MHQRNKPSWISFSNYYNIRNSVAHYSEDNQVSYVHLVFFTSWQKLEVGIRVGQIFGVKLPSKQRPLHGQRHCHTPARTTRLLKRTAKFMHGHGLRSNPETYSVLVWDRTRSKDRFVGRVQGGGADLKWSKSFSSGQRPTMVERLWW